MNFQPVSFVRASGGRGGRTTATPFATFYNRDGNFRLNAAGLEKLGNPDFITVLHDSESGAVAFVPAPENQGAPLRKADKSGSRMISYAAFGDVAQTIAPGAAKLRGEIADADENGYFIVNLAGVAAKDSDEDETEAETAEESAEVEPELATAGSRRR